MILLNLREGEKAILLECVLKWREWSPYIGKLWWLCDVRCPFCPPTVIEGGILDVHAKTWNQWRQWGFSRTMGWAILAHFRQVAPLTPPLSRRPSGSCQFCVLGLFIHKSGSRQHLIDWLFIFCRFFSIYMFFCYIHVSTIVYSGSRYFIWKLCIASIVSLY